MLETGLSGLMSGDGKRDGALPSAPALVLDSTIRKLFLNDRALRPSGSYGNASL
jgi:hypothetical protein